MSLLALPSELLQHIARFLPCSSLLEFVRVNRQVRDACYDPLVFRDVAQDALLNTPGAVDHLLDLYRQPDRVSLKLEQLDWSEGEFILNESSLEDKVRIAYAVEECVRISMVKADDQISTLRRGLTANTTGMAERLPHLLALHHPASWGLEPDMFLLPHGQLGQSDKSSTSSLLMNRWLSRTAGQARDRLATTKLQAIHFINLSFILNYITLQRLGSTNTSKDVLSLFIQYFVPGWTEPDLAQFHASTQDMAKTVIQQLSERVPSYGTFIRDFTLTQASAALLPLLIAIASSYDTREQRLLPVPAKMPFRNFMDIPSVYHNSAELFTTCHYKRMTAPDFLSGTWLGYYSDQRSFRRTFLVDPPMENIQMVVREPEEEARTRLRIRAVIDRETRGFDSHGDFLLSGRVREDGLVSIAKQYLGNGFSWTWTGRVTPFGIVGVWGAHSFGGYFWIFKKEWV